MDPTFRTLVQEAAYRYARGNLTYGVSQTRKTRGGRFYSVTTTHFCDDAILRRVGKKSWEITTRTGYTILKREGSEGFGIDRKKFRPITERSYRILLKKRSAHPATTA